MFYWSPSATETESYTPLAGWNPTFSEQDKIQYTNLFFFFKNKKGFKENTADTLAQMTLFKKKYSGLQYSKEQEQILENALKPIFNM